MDNLTPCTIDTTIIGALATTSEARGLTEQQFKDIFDKFGLDFKTFFNNTHLPDVKAKVVGEVAAKVLTETTDRQNSILDVLSIFNWSQVLHNTDFVNPVNQFGVSGTISTLGDFVDRWKLTSGTVTLTTNGFQLNGTIAQTFEKDAPSTLPHLEMYSGTATASYNSGAKTLSITSSGGVIKYVNKPFEDYATELAKCRRYQYVPDMSTLHCSVGRGSASSTTIACIAVDFPVKMRIPPTLTVDYNDFKLQDFANPYIDTTNIIIDPLQKGTDSVVLIVYSTGLTQYRPYQLFSAAAGKKIVFSARL